MTQLEELIKEYKETYELFKSTVGQTITLPNYTYNGSKEVSSTAEPSVEACANTLSSTGALGGTFYDTTGNNCFLYSDSSPTVSGNGTAIVQTEQYYNEKMAELYDKINPLLNITEEPIQSIPPLSTKKYEENNQKFTHANALNLFINNKYTNSISNLKIEEIKLRVWLFIFLIAMIFFFMNISSLQILSFVFLFLAIVVLFNIIKTINLFIFTIIILLSFAFIVLSLFFKKLYIPSFVILIIGALGYDFMIKYPFIIVGLLFVAIISLFTGN